MLEAIATGEVVDYRDAQHSNVKYLTENRAIEIIRVDDDWSRMLPALRRSSEEMDVVTESNGGRAALAVR